MKFAIRNRWTNSVKFEAEIDCDENAPLNVQAHLAVKWAIQTHADLTFVNLTGADLTRANLTGADLTGAKLKSANLTGANLTGANLTHADLTGADLAGANLNLTNLTCAILTGTNLIHADLTRTDLTRADLTYAKNDFWNVLSLAHHEVSGLLQTLRDGKIDGGAYEGECNCLIGTIAKIRDVDYRRLGDGLHPNCDRPAERLFLSISKGDTPENSPLAKIVENWIVEFMAKTSDKITVS